MHLFINMYHIKHIFCAYCLCLNEVFLLSNKFFVCIETYFIFLLYVGKIHKKLFQELHKIYYEKTVFFGSIIGLFLLKYFCWGQGKICNWECRIYLLAFSWEEGEFRNYFFERIKETFE